MSYLSAILLGLIQGLTEFLPVSSSGHLVIAQHLLGFKGPEIAFDVMLHLGTLLAVLIYFKNDIMHIAYTAVSKTSEFNGRRWIAMLVVASIPTAAIGLAFKEPLEKSFANSHAVAIQLWITALLLLITDRVWVRESTGKKIKTYQALVIGIAQGIAIIPGISRSGSTISAGVFCGLNRNVAARFSFLLSIPAILGACLLELKKFAQIHSADILPYLVGTTVAFISGYLSIDVLIRILVKRKLWKFGVYLLIVGLIALIFT